MAAVLQLLDHLHRHIDGDGERQAHETTGTAVYLRIDAYHFAVQVEQRATGIAGVDGHVGLNEGHIVLARQGTALGADNAGGRGMIKTKGRADGQYPFAHLELLGTADLHHRQMLRINLQQGDITAFVTANQRGFQLTTVTQAYQNFRGVLDDVMIGHHIAIG